MGALGLAQAWALRTTYPRLKARIFVWATILIAGLGWAGASVPGALAEPSAGGEPPQWLLVLGGAGLGLVLGPLLGTAQMLGLIGVAAHPWRWVLANLIGWIPAMAIIFAGATTPTVLWQWWQVLLVGTGTGAAAGSALGVVLGW